MTFYTTIPREPNILEIDVKDCNFSCVFDSPDIFLSNGELIDINYGKILNTYKQLDECKSVAILPNNQGYIGINNSGLLRHWNKKDKINKKIKIKKGFG